ncbi:hypothetical protein JB92DRAFT_2985107 [Gautieria morchelliformis]|nr:hypothetical protein JB92DRAFT_2985107 [Gautieria morchelliformis]
MDQELDTLYSLLWSNHIITYNNISATALLLYDTIVTLDQEINLIWRSSWSFVTALYLLIRHYSVAYLILSSYVSINVFLTESFCGHYMVFQEWGTIILLPAVDILIILRVYALFGRSTKIGILLVVLWLAETISLFTLFQLDFKPTTAVMPNPLPGVLPGCFPLQDTHFPVARIGAIASVFQAIYFGLTAVALYKEVRPFGFSLSPILRVFFRDGAVYSFVILVLYLWNTISVGQLKGPLQGVSVPWLNAIFPIIAARLVLNLRRSARLSDDLSSDDIEFDGISSRGAGDGQLTSVFGVTVVGLRSVDTESV